MPIILADNITNDTADITDINLVKALIKAKQSDLPTEIVKPKVTVLYVRKKTVDLSIIPNKKLRL